MYDLKINHCTIVTATDRYDADIAINNGRIELIGRKLPGRAKEELDADGCLVMPGGIDIHTHLDMPFGGTTSADDFYTGTVAAACGGTTTIIDFAIQGQGESLISAVEKWKTKAAGKAVIDYGFHVAITDCTDAVVEELPAIVAAGVTSVKLFMAYKGSLMVRDDVLFRVFQKAAVAGILPLVHAENGDVIDVLIKQFQREGKMEPKYHALSRPAVVEGEATGRALDLAQVAGNVPLFVVHVTCREALERIERARALGRPAFAETCPQYLFLTAERYEEKNFGGAKYVMSPPLRTQADCDALWRALRTGVLSSVGSDHCPFNMKDQKVLGRDNFALIPNGVPGIETRLPLLFSEGVKKGRISLNRFVEITSTAPAKLFGLFPKKGTIAAGSDADIVILDPEKKTTLSARTLHQNVDYCPYEGMKLEGAVRTVLSRGVPVVRNGKFVGRRGAGQFLARAAFKAPALLQES